MTLTDKATGMVIGTVRLPFGYQAMGMLRPEVSSGETAKLKCKQTVD